MYRAVRRSPIRTIVISIFASVMLAACNQAPTAVTKTFTIGLLTNSPTMDVTVNAFKAGLADLGYVEGKNVTYQDPGVLTARDDVAKAVQNLVAANVDLIFAPGTTAVAAKKGTEGTNIPVIFAALPNPVELGLVQDLGHPEGNVTGVAYQIEAAGKALEYLQMLVPTAKRVLVIYDPKGPGAPFVSTSKNIAAKLGLQLVLHEIHSEQDATSTIQNMPTDVDALFVVPDIWLAAHIVDLLKASADRKLPAISAILGAVSNGAVLAYGRNQTEEGKQAARIASQIFNGSKPASLPVEHPDYFLWINLKTAQAIGLNIPDNIVRQAKGIIR